jgi:YfiH family protein
VILQSALLSRIDGVRHAFFTREGGVSKGLYDSLNGGVGSQDEPADVTENRQRMTTALGVASNRLVSAFQIHSADVAIVDRSWVAGTRPRVDGFATKTPGYAIAAAAADCTPILFADGQARVIGAAHAGWKGALTGIAEATIDAMEKLGASRGRIVAAIGPLIRQQNYEVGPEFVARFVDADAANARFFIPSKKAGHSMFDLAGYVRMRLERAGVEHIDDLGLCTYADEKRFFSYRRSVHRNEPDYGRHIHAIALQS